MSRISAESFLSLIQQSGLVEEDRLQREVDSLEAQGHNVAEASSLADSLVERDLLTEWQAEKLLRGKHKGFTLGKYRLRRLLGKGGMSSVYLAEHVLMRRQCAIKVLPIKRVEDTSYLARFHREARAVASLDHPNIVRAYDIDHETEGDKDIHFLVMEYVDGESLHDCVKDKGPLSLDDTAEFFRQAALGLENAHKNGLIHRDVKPGNLLIDRSEVVKVLDLGLARFSEVTDDNPLTLAHDEKVLGTADFLAPEQAMDSHTADHRADIYGLGCTAYFALTGYPPFREGTLTQRLMFHQTKEPPALAGERPEIGNTPRGVELDKIVHRMMAKKPDERFQTMGEVATAFARWLKIYATADWRNAHPDAFFKSDAGASGGALPVAKAVAVPVAKAVAPNVAAPVAKVVTGGDAQLQGLETQTPDVAKATAAPPVPVSSDSPPVASPVSHPVASPPENPIVAAAAPVEAAPAEPEPASDDGADPGFGAFLAGFDGGSDAGAPAFAEPTPASPIVTESDAAQPDAVESTADADDVVPVAEAVPVAEEVIPEPVVDLPVAAPVFEPATLPESAPVEAVATDDLLGWDDESPAAEPLANFDASVLPAPIGNDDEEAYPSLLGGTPTGKGVVGVDDPAEATMSAMEQTQDYVPSGNTPTEIPSDATLVNPIEPSSDANHDIVPAAQPVVTAPVAPPVEQFSFEPAENDAPVFPGTPIADVAVPAAPQLTSPVEPPPASPQTFAAPADEAPMFPGVESASPAPLFDPAASAPTFGESALPAFPTETPAFGAPPSQFAAETGYAQPPVSAARSSAKKKPPVAIIAGILIALVAGVGAYFAFTGGSDAKSSSKKTASGDSKSKSSSAGNSSAGKGKSSAVGGSSGRVLGSTIKVGPGGDFSTIAAALDYLKKNKSRYDTGSRRTSCKVEVIGGETYNEAIVVDNSGSAYPPGIQILSSGVGRAKLVPSGSGPAIRLVGVENLGIVGFDVDASGKDVAIEMSGYLNRSALKDLNVTGFSKVGIAMKGALGFSQDEIVLEKIDLRGSGTTTAGIHFTQGENGTGRIKLLNCRMLGPQDAGLLFESDVNYVEMRENIIADAGVGIEFRGGPLTLKDVQVLNTTFYKCSRGGMIINQMPVAGGGLAGSGGLVIHRNLFAQVNGPELLVEKDFDDKKFDSVFSAAGGGVDQNWSDRRQAADVKAGQREIIGRDHQRVPSIEFSSTDENSPDFLTLKKSTGYANVGGPKLNTKNYIGARPAR
tara:strand:- start:125484 stop:129218 length:3735 start_codon:yes stop_codon:yes gene_type:complete